MEKMIYPFSNSLLPILEAIHNKESLNYIKYAVTPPSWRKHSDDVGGDIIFSSDYDSTLDLVDTVIIADFTYNDYLYKDVLKKMEIALQKDKKVVCYHSLKQEDKTRLESLYHESFELISSLENETNISSFRYTSQDSVVIGIGNMMNGLDETHIIIGLTEAYEELGYNVASISTNHNTRLLGYIDFPSEIFNDSISEENKVLALNTFIHEIEEQKCPDIIVIQFPSGMMKYTEVCHGGFCVKSFMLSQALSVDFFILNLPCLDSNALTYEKCCELSRVFQYRYDFSIDHFCFDNKIIDDSASIEEEDIIYQFIDIESIDDLVSMISKGSHELSCSSTFDKESYKLIVQKSIEKLSTIIEEF